MLFPNPLYHFLQTGGAKSDALQIRLLLFLFTEVGSARLGERVKYTLSVRRPQYEPIDRKKRKGKIVEDYSKDRAA